jgi:teichuronic acid biosynthesis glycosyltransferase TuaH
MPGPRRNVTTVIDELIFFSLEDWDEVWRRNQFLCMGLARRRPQLRILFVAPERDASNALRTGRWGEFGAPPRRPVSEDGRILCFRPWKLLPNTLTWGRKFNEWLVRRQVRAEARRLGFRAPLLWINSHGAGHAVGALRERAVIYDITDDWTTLTQSPHMIRLTQRQDQHLCQKADAVIVCSQRLQEMKAPLTNHLHLIPNGVHAEHYQRVAEASGPLPEDARPWKKPVLGYTGSIHADRVDLCLVEALARRLPHATIALVGPIMLSPAERQRLENFSNIALTGPKPYSLIPDYMRGFDACITPHLVTPFTESLNPIKLWEYLAAGKPIISTPVAGFRDYPQFVRLANDAEGFARALDAALAEAPATAEQRRAEARKHSWDARLEAVEAVIAGCLAHGSLRAASHV